MILFVNFGKKFKTISNGNMETNHTLSKCGLIENIILHKRIKNTTLIILKRDIVKQCLSYIIRNDFTNITVAWQWYLHPSYARNLIKFEPFQPLGNLALPLWYCYEMEARQEYYFQRFSNYMKMIEIKLEDAVTQVGAERFYTALGLRGYCEIPDATNVNKLKPDQELIDTVQNIVNELEVDMPKLVAKAIKEGFKFT